MGRDLEPDGAIAQLGAGVGSAGGLGFDAEAWSRTRAAVAWEDSYQRCVIWAATSRPPSPKARPKARASAPTSPMNRVSTNLAAIPI